MPIAALAGSEARERGDNLMYRVYPEYSEGGYADKRSVLQGDTITFYVANALKCFPARIMRADGQPGTPSQFTVVQELGELCGNSPRSWCTPQWGCDWQPTYKLTVPAEWPSGYYILDFPVKLSRERRHVNFVVAERKPTAAILFLVDFLTAQAYNVYGGSSLYGGFGVSPTWSPVRKATQVSFRRPLVQSHTYGDADRIVEPMPIPQFEEPFRAALARKFKVAYLSNDALEKFGLEYVRQYRLIIVAGVHEYWTNRMLDIVEAYVNQGGNLYLSASEFGFGAIRLSEDGDAIQYYYDPRNDPVYETNPEQVATFRAAVSDVENFFGVSLEQGKGLGIQGLFAPLKVVNPANWVFAGTKLSQGDVLTDVQGLGVGGWVDQRPDGRYCLTGTPIPCENVEVLALAPYPALDTRFEEEIDILLDGRVDHIASSPSGTTFAIVALIHQEQGSLFIAPGNWWNIPHSHNYDPRVQTVIANVIRKLSTGQEAQ